MDVAAHVCSKKFQIRHYIQGQNAVPLSWQHQVLEGAVERLENKSLLVRKNSIALILERNPFSAKLSLAELRKQYGTEDGQLQEIRNKMHGPNLNEEFQKKENEVNFLKDSIRACLGSREPKVECNSMSSSGRMNCTTR
ncbi:hypothetical protein pipiens_012299 [Culex pipiens pipiens]|uniref:Uncharacterized protein n=1 Tax=Culex pipiens pipiens TaxID=38569 RepID=A0ABD1D2V9_CULPP